MTKPTKTNITPIQQAQQDLLPPLQPSLASLGLLPNPTPQPQPQFLPPPKTALQTAMEMGGENGR